MAKTKLPLLVVIILLIGTAGFLTQRATKGQTQHFITLTWTAPATGATSYNVYRSTTTGTGYVKLINCTTVTVNDTTGVGGTKYFYVVRSVDAVGNESVNSNETSATAIGNPNPPTEQQLYLIERI